MNSNLHAIIRNSLAAAQAALDLLDKDSAPALVSAAPAPYVCPPRMDDEIAPTCNEYQASPFDRLMQELEDPRYTLRSVRELAEKVRLDEIGVRDMLHDEDIGFVIKHRRSDGAELIGLASRN